MLIYFFLFAIIYIYMIGDFTQHCITQDEYLDIQPPPHNNQTNADYLLTTSTEFCYRPFDIYFNAGIELLFFIFGLAGFAMLLKNWRK